MVDTPLTSTETAEGETSGSALDLSALNDISTNGALGVQMLGEVTKALEGLANIVMPVPSGGTGRDDLTDHAVLVGAGTDPVTLVSPSATSGVPLVGQGSSADPVFGTAAVAGGGTGRTSSTAYAVICGGTTSTAAQQSIASVGTANQRLTSNGASALPTFQSLPVCASFTFKSPSDETVALILNSAIAWTITQTNTITEVGTATVAVKIGTTTLGGGTNAASTSLNTVAHASANAIVATNQINVTFTSTSGTCENLCLTIWGTYP